MIDIVKPNKNEEEFIETAARLKLDGLVFYYPKISKHVTEKISTLREKTQLKIFIASSSTGTDVNLYMVEKAGRKDIEKKPDIIFNQEKLHEKDYLTNPNSGLDQIICRIVKEKKVIIGFAFSVFLNSNPTERIKLLPRIRQNILLCRKYKLDTAIFSFAEYPFQMRNLSDLRSFYFILGMQSLDSKRALETLQERIAYNEKKKKGLIIAEGVEKVSE